MGCTVPFGGSPNFNPFGLGAQQPYYAPQPQRAPQPVRSAPAKPQPAKQTEAPLPVVVPTPEQLGIHLPDAPVVVPTPKELGIDLD